MENQTFSKPIQIASMICVIHCIITPILIITTPLLGQFLDTLSVELGLLSISTLLGISIIYKSYCKHKKTHSILLYTIGVALWGLHSLLEYHDINGAKICFFVGTVLVLASYYISHQLLKCCPYEGCQH